MTELSFSVAIVLCLGSAVMWGTYCNFIKHVKKFGEIEFSNSLLIGALCLAWFVSLVVEKEIPNWGLGTLVALIGGITWGVGNYGSLVAVRELGLARSYPIINLCGIVAFFWGVGAFGEMRTAGAGEWVWLLAGSGVAVMTLGAFMASRSLESSRSGKTRRGTLHAVVAALCFGTFGGGCIAASLRLGLSPTTYCALAATGATFLYFFYSGSDPKRFRRWIGGGKHEHFLGICAGMLWMGGNLLNFASAPTLGVATAFPIGLLSTITAMFWGIFYYGEFKGLSRRAYAYGVMGTLALMVGVLILTCARSSVPP